MQLNGKTIVVTGGAGILGQAVAQGAKQAGAEVVLLDVIQDFQSDLGRCFSVDLTDQAAVNACFSEIGDFDWAGKRGRWVCHGADGLCHG